jgi:signal transduction histidine kinase
VTTNLNPVEPLVIAGIRDHVKERTPTRPRSVLFVIVAALLVAGAGVLAAVLDTTADVGPGRVLCAVLVVLWCACAVVVATQRPGEPLAWIMVAGAAAGAATVLGATFVGRDLSSGTALDAAYAARAFGLALLPAVGLHAVLGMPDGRLRTQGRRITTGSSYVASLALGAYLFGQRPELPLVALAVLIGIDAVAAISGFVARGQHASLTERPRFQWPAWGLTVALAIGIGAGILNALVDWPESVFAIAVAATGLVPVSIAIAASDRVAVRIDRLLVHTIVLAGLVGLVGISYLLIVLGLGRTPTDDERSLLGLSMFAAAVAALLWVPTREWLDDFATRRVYGERHAPDEVLRTFGSRLTRAIPLDELLLQLAESLQKTMALEIAEVWTRGAGGRVERAVSIPDRGPAGITLGVEEEPVVARAGVSGPAWIAVWLPGLLEHAGQDPVMRVAPVTNSGELLGLIVVRRPEGAPRFEEEDDRALTELARQVGLALHNVRLDSALQESLDELRRQADELRASRVRVVEAGDAQRRRIERDLHDGAQQHLVALAVNVRLARQLADRDPEQAKTMLDQLGTDLQEAVQELRSLAHGIYPPLLAERGLPDALSAAATRAAIPTSVNAEDVGRYPQLLEAAVYFCCLEALQNAGKHAGEGSQATITLKEDEGALLFEVADDGAGFDPASGAGKGHGFVNMADRVGAIGGTLAVDSSPGKGTRISARIPLTEERA